MLSTPELNEQNLYALYGLIHVPWWQTKVFFVILALGACAALGLAIAAYRAYRKKKSRKQTPWEIAILELKALSQTPAMTDAHKSNIFYGQLWWIIKKYLSSRYGLFLNGVTESEMIVLLSKQEDFPRRYQPLVKEVFDRAVLAKFSNDNQAHEMRAHDLDSVVRLVNDTVPPKIVLN